MEISKTLKEFRKREKLTQSEVAKYFNTTQDTISLWEKEKRLPSIEQLLLLCYLTDTSPNEILNYEDNDKKYIKNSYNKISNSNNITFK